MYWLRTSEKKGNFDAPIQIGLLYEGLKNHQQALRYYRTQADQNSDFRAQVALGRMYEKGLGVARDVPESQRWEKLAETQKRAAGKICTSQKVRDEAFRLMAEERLDPDLRMAQLFALGSGFVANLGEMRINSITLGNLSSINRPYTCEITAINIGASLEDFTPDFEYVGTDDHGNDRYIDRRLEQMVRGKAAEFATERASGPYTRSLRIEPQMNKSFKLTLKPEIGLSREYSTVVSLP